MFYMYKYICTIHINEINIRIISKNHIYIYIFIYIYVLQIYKYIYVYIYIYIYIYNQIFLLFI